MHKIVNVAVQNNLGVLESRELDEADRGALHEQYVKTVQKCYNFGFEVNILHLYSVRCKKTLNINTYL